MKINGICYWTNFYAEGKDKLTFPHTVMLVKAESLQTEKQERDVFLVLCSVTVLTPPRYCYDSKFNAKTWKSHIHSTKMYWNPTEVIRNYCVTLCPEWTGKQLWHYSQTVRCKVEQLCWITFLVPFSCHLWNCCRLGANVYFLVNVITTTRK